VKTKARSMAWGGGENGLRAGSSKVRRSIQPRKIPPKASFLVERQGWEVEADGSGWAGECGRGRMLNGETCKEAEDEGPQGVVVWAAGSRAAKDGRRLLAGGKWRWSEHRVAEGVKTRQSAVRL
jgi:hypothetical protein